MITKICTNHNAYKKKVALKPYKGEMLHSTGANNPYLSRYCGTTPELGENRYANSLNDEGFEDEPIAHDYVGYLKDKVGVETVNALPYDIQCWSSGSGKNGRANDNYIQTEVCEDALMDKDYLMRCLETWSKNAAARMVKNGILTVTSTNCIDHAEGGKLGIASNTHADITHWLTRFGLTMTNVREMVQSEINAILSSKSSETAESIKDVAEASKSSNIAENQANSANPTKLYRVQVGAFASKANAMQFLERVTELGLTGFIVEG